MPDATITSTASTFGTITGTFAADQSTVTGTITGVVAGTLTGSVGVPGPVGPTGPAGATGPQGVPGAPGPGLPAGGEDGQIIVKDGTVDYATIWTDNSAETLTVRATNKTGSTLNKGAVVRINGAQGQRPTIALAQGNSGASADGVIGILLATLANNATGLVCTAGLAKRLDTSAYAEGVKLFLSPSVAGGLTPTRPSAPDHAVAVGIVSHSSATTGSIEVNVVVGDHLEWLHDVLITTPTNGQVLKYDSATSLWKNQTDLNSGVWGSITGTLSSQTDLQTALDGKYSTSNPAGYITSSALTPYLTSATAALTYQTISGMSSYLTTASAASTYQTISGMSSYLTTADAVASYYPLSGNPSGFLTSASLSGYATESWVSSFSFATESWVSSNFAQIESPTFTGTVTIPSGASISGYLTTSSAASTYAPLASPALTGNPTAPTPDTADNDTSIATTAFVKAQGYLTSAPVTSVAGKTGAVTLVNTDISGLGTMATANTADYSTTTVANGLYYPLSSNPAGYLTSAPVTSVAGRTGAVTLAVADVSGAAPLASPALSGVPTAPTATAGTNTTQLATTAFVTTAVPAFATFSTPGPTSTTTVVSPKVVMDFMMHPGFRQWNVRGSSVTSGAGAVVQAYSTGCTEVVGPNVSVAGFSMAIWDTGTSSFGMLGMTRGANGLARAWNKPVWASGRGQHGFYGDANYNGTVNSVVRVSVGGKSFATSGDISINDPGFGWYYIPGSAMVLQVSRGNGTSLTNVTTSFTPNAREIFDWKIYSDGAGNVTLYINDSQVATTTAGPTTATAESFNFYFESVEQTASAAARIVWESINPKIYWGV
jgi:hypothetical protein